MIKKEITREDLIQISEFVYEIQKSFRPDMRVPAQVYMNDKMMDAIMGDRSLEQLVNVATLPGIKKYALAMPDIHQGYGFPIGGVAATAVDEGGVISPGGIGYDINCGVRLLTTNMKEKELRPHMQKLATACYHAVPSGVGRGSSFKLSLNELDKVLKKGAAYMVMQGYGIEDDLEYCEEHGCMHNADSGLISDRAKKRGSDQLGTLGAGNHFLEIQKVDEIYDLQVAQTFGLSKDLVIVMIHCGSRGLGHQTCTDYVRRFMGKLADYGIELPDRELVCAPFKSNDGADYFNAMAAAANFGWANRHLIGHEVRNAFKKVIGKEVLLTTIYDISHNIGKVEKHVIGNREIELLVHRKGATRSFGPGRPEIPARYRNVGQPVLIPGTMGTASYILVGAETSMGKTFGTTCHGAGRRLSRAQAKKTVRGSQLRERLEQQGIIIRCEFDAGLAEEAPIAYKDVDNVVDVVDGAGLAKKVARFIPLAVIKG
jgi:tRNA-splicing ligase RtcB